MKILIVSDTHRMDDILKKVIGKEKPFDMFIQRNKNKLYD